jgi:predicted dithiol-disulfide oxidoreductase (DUF899 family)
MSNLENPLTREYPKIVSRAKWLNARKKLLAKEKELTRHRDAVNAERRRLPMVRIEKNYFFDGRPARCGCSICSRIAARNGVQNL